MNQSALKTFAQETRRKLRDLIGGRLDYVLSADTAELRQQAAQVNELRTALKNEGRDLLIERVAYTWFNRLAALRFMDANGYHPFGARVITPATANETLPELLQQTRAGVLDADFKSQIANLKTFDDILAGRIPVENVEAHIYRLLLVAACNYYHQLMPFMFERIGDATELLLPVDLLTQHSIVADFRENLTDEDCRNEEVLGWFYQYYISEKKAEVMGRNAAVPKQDIPAVTQLFTPHWIVRYLVENSLGRLWLLNRPHSKLREKMPYYIEGEAETDFLKITKPEEIRLLDPAGGSGHMLTYAFDLLYAIYEEEGYDAPEIPSLILRHNLYGVDICDRAVALATFALCMKARAKDNRFFRRLMAGGGSPLQPHLIALQEIHFDEGELSAYFKAIGLQPSAIHPELTKLLYQFEEAKNFGSLIQPCLSEPDIFAAREKLSTLNTKLLARDLTVALTHAKVLRVLEQAEYLCQRYRVVVTNPPYMGKSSYNPLLKKFAEYYYPDAKSDLYGCFMRRCCSLVDKRGWFALITIPNWMFLSSFEDLRLSLLTEKHITSLTHLGRGVWGSDFGSCAFVIANSPAKSYQATYKRLFLRQGEVSSCEELEQNFFNTATFPNYHASSQELMRITGHPLAYWATERETRVFETCKPFSAYAEAIQGIITGNTEHFIRFWFEVDFKRTTIGTKRYEDFNPTKAYWVPYTKGGALRKWFGNNDCVINWRQQGADLVRSRNTNSSYYFKPCLTWTLISSSSFAARYCPEGFLWDVSGSIAFADSDIKAKALLAFLCSSLSHRFLNLVNPTINTNIENILSLPIPDQFELIKANVKTFDNSIDLAREDWNNFETSWDFSNFPLLRPGLKGTTLSASWQRWKAHCDDTIRQMQELETENNRLFITAYGLQDEIKPEVPEDQITLARADERKDMAAFLSYAVGCMMGRYALDQPGLFLADAGASLQDYLAKIPKPTFAPDADGIIPVLDGEWFTDDIVGRFREFLRVTFGDATLAENLAFIEASLGKELPQYFTREFFKDHLKTYKKRPIYWMFSSPEGSFQALIYLHRYNRDTVSVLLNDYVREFIGKLEEKHRQQTIVTLNESARPGDRTKAAKEISKIDKILKEIRAWERDVLLPLAQQRLEIDLDDGVKVNYLKFKGAVVNIPGLDKGDEE